MRFAVSARFDAQSAVKSALGGGCGYTVLSNDRLHTQHLGVCRHRAYRSGIWGSRLCRRHAARLAPLRPYERSGKSARLAQITQYARQLAGSPPLSIHDPRTACRGGINRPGIPYSSISRSLGLSGRARVAASFRRFAVLARARTAGEMQRFARGAARFQNPRRYGERASLVSHVHVRVRRQYSSSQCQICGAGISRESSLFAFTQGAYWPSFTLHTASLLSLLPLITLLITYPAAAPALTNRQPNFGAWRRAVITLRGKTTTSLVET
ncbi:hypothetical protein KCP74_17375 [Salmonella enterica subsp. enterica]|nr:hypothetical protein KCP74_17375 [Salmonella enterica subsp. enterica]